METVQPESLEDQNERYTKMIFRLEKENKTMHEALQLIGNTSKPSNDCSVAIEALKKCDNRG